MTAPVFSISTIGGSTFGAMIVGVVVSLWPEPVFMKVHEMRVVGSDVVVTRTISEPTRIADWRVTVVPEAKEPPICATVPGPELHQGWSVYTPGPTAEMVMPLDVWVGDPGCFERLISGNHKMFVTWTPRDGSRPVTAQAEFVKE